MRSRARSASTTPTRSCPTTRAASTAIACCKSTSRFRAAFCSSSLMGLHSAVRRCQSSELELLVLLDREDASLEGLVDAARLLPFCAPAINLFPRQADRIHLSERDHEYHVVPDRTRPLDLEIYRIEKVDGYGARNVREREFLPLYSPRAQRGTRGAFFTVQRKPRLLSSQARARWSALHLRGQRSLLGLGRWRRRPISARLASARDRDAVHQPRLAAAHVRGPRAERLLAAIRRARERSALRRRPEHTARIARPRRARRGA